MKDFALAPRSTFASVRFVLTDMDETLTYRGRSLISIVLVVGLVSVTALLADAANADMATRVGMFVTIVAVVIVVSIWQAAGLAVTRIHRIILEQQGEMGLGR